jgi:hypothetical protein
METKEGLLERLAYMWAAASSSCGGDLPRILEEIREIEKKLAAFEETP